MLLVRAHVVRMQGTPQCTRHRSPFGIASVCRTCPQVGQTTGTSDRTLRLGGQRCMALCAALVSRQQTDRCRSTRCDTTSVTMVTRAEGGHALGKIEGPMLGKRAGPRWCGPSNDLQRSCKYTRAAAVLRFDGGLVMYRNTPHSPVSSGNRVRTRRKSSSIVRWVRSCIGCCTGGPQR